MSLCITTALQLTTFTLLVGPPPPDSIKPQALPGPESDAPTVTDKAAPAPSPVDPDPSPDDPVDPDVEQEPGARSEPAPGPESPEAVTDDSAPTPTPEASVAPDAWFGPPDPGAVLSEHLERSLPGFGQGLALAIEQAFDAVLPIELALHQAPRRAKTNDGRYHSLDYQCIPPGGPPERILLIVSDVTAVVEKQRADAEQAQLLAALDRIRAVRFHGLSS